MNKSIDLNVCPCCQVILIVDDVIKVYIAEGVARICVSPNKRIRIRYVLHKILSIPFIAFCIRNLISL